MGGINDCNRKQVHYCVTCVMLHTIIVSYITAPLVMARIISMLFIIFVFIVGNEACNQPPPAPAPEPEPKFLQDLRVQSGEIFLPEDSVRYLHLVPSCTNKRHAGV